MNLLLVCVLVYVAFAGFLYIRQRGFMYFPDTTRPQPVEGAWVIQVQTADGLSIEGWHFPPEKPGRPVIVFFHGNAENLGTRADKISPYTAAGYGVLLAGYRGYGGNAGSPSEEGLYKDGRAFMDFILSQNEGPAVLYGESLGTGVAVQMAAEYETAGLILEAPFPSTVDVARRSYFYLPVKLLMKDQYRNIDKIGNVHAPLLVLHGEADAVTPIALGRRLFAAANEPKTFVSFPGAGHTEADDYGAPLHVLEFLRNIAGTPAPTIRKE